MRNPLAVLLLLLAALAAPAAAQQRDPAQVSLVDAGAFPGAGHKTRLAALVIRLDDGWKTYWRVPGEGGAPPRFDFSASEGVAGVEVFYPVPKRFSDPITGNSIGYAGEVAFPLKVRLSDATRPAVLRLKLDYAVCGRMCIPLQARAELRLDPRAEAPETVRAYVLQWLKKTPFADDGALQVGDVRLVREGEGLKLLLAVSGAGARQVRDILVEGVDLALFGPAEALKGQGGGTRRFAIPVHGLATEKDFRGATLRLTLLKGETAIERRVKLP